MNNKKLLYSILMIIPVLSGPLAVLYAKEFNPDGAEWIANICVAIPFVNLIAAIVLIIMNLKD